MRDLVSKQDQNQVQKLQHKHKGTHVHEEQPEEHEEEGGGGRAGLEAALEVEVLNRRQAEVGGGLGWRDVEP